jgi:hypothetical protein
MLGLASLGIGAISGLNQLFTGYKQRKEANRIQAIRPEYQIAGALQENVAAARQGANAQMPGMGTAVNKLQASTANAARAAQMAGGSNNALAAIVAAQGNEANALNNLHDQQSNYRMQMQGNLQSQLGQLAQEQKAKWDYDSRQKYEEQAQAKAALTSASLQNMHGGISNLSNLGMAGLQGLQGRQQEQNEQQVNSVSGFHRAQLNGFKSTPLFGGTLSSYPFG